MTDIVAIKQKLEAIRHELFDYNHYEVLTINGWSETWLISVYIGRIIMIEVANPAFSGWVASGKEGAQPASSLTYRMDEAMKYLRRSTKASCSIEGG